MLCWFCSKERIGWHQADNKVCSGFASVPFSLANHFTAGIWLFLLLLLLMRGCRFLLTEVLAAS